MAVTTTPIEIITAAYSHSKKSAPGRVITEATEGLQIVTRALRGLYSVAARINPEFFGASTDVAFATPGWARPLDSETVFRIENPSGDEVIIVPISERTLDPATPAVYRLGQVYRPAGNANDPTSGNLTMFYSKRPAQPANINTAVDALWCESYNELLALEVAIYIAMKDGRAEEVGMLKPERDKWAVQYVAFLEHETAGEVRRFDRTFYTPSMIPIGGLFAGGSNAVSK